jgi:multicomponent K+:H+ antiporter subunit G
MMMLADILISVLLVGGACFGLVGSVGLLKLTDTMQRLHAPTKATTLGVGSALIGSMAAFALFEGKLSWHELMITLFLLLTAPVTGNLLAKAHIHRAIQRDQLPETGVSDDWATFDTDGPSRLLPDIAEAEAKQKP